MVAGGHDLHGWIRPGRFIRLFHRQICLRRNRPAPTGHAGQDRKLDAFEQTFNTFSWQIVFLAGFTPIPYKVFTIASGAFDVALAVFFIASVVSRGGRFFLVAVIVALLGPVAKPLIERYFGWFTLAAGLVVVAGIFAYTALH